MRELKATKINTADFAPFGTFCNMTKPEGYPLQGEIHKFYPDRISGSTGFCRHTCSGTYQSIYSSKGNYGKIQYRHLAFMSTSFKQ